MRENQEVIMIANRLITVIAGYPFYLSSGTESQQSGTWFPFLGFKETPMTNPLDMVLGWLHKPDDYNDVHSNEAL